MQILALADDLTGSIEVGAKFAGQGIATLVTTQLRISRTDVPNDVEALVINTESRHLPQAEAARKIYELSRAARDQGIRYLYKKTDSTLRGNIGSELGAVLAAHPGSPLIYVPAYPQMGRTVEQGRLYVNGQLVTDTPFAADKLNPIASSLIPDALAAQTSSPIHSISVDRLETVSHPGIFVLDGEADADLVAAARVFMRSSTLRLAAGPAGFAQYLAQFADLPRTPPRPWPSVRSCLIVNGSPNEVSEQQISWAREHGFCSIEPQAIPNALADPQWFILDCPGGAPSAEADSSLRLGAAVGDILRRVEIDALVVFGGDTAYAVLQATGGALVWPIGEILPGVPLSSMPVKIGAREWDLCLITKAGGFGAKNILASIRRLLSREK